MLYSLFTFITCWLQMFREKETDDELPIKIANVIMSLTFKRKRHAY